MGNNQKRFLVTGGNGYIGSHMCKLLHQAGHQVEIIDSWETCPERETHSFGRHHRVDIGNDQEVLKILQEFRPEAIFHFAARAIVPESESDPMLYYIDNMAKSAHLLRATLQAGVKKFIFSSTCATYGIPTQGPLTEGQEQNPTNTYGRTKKIIEEMLADLANKKLLDVVVFRYFNVVGSSPETDIGENHAPETHIIPNLCLAHLSGGKNIFNLYGTELPTKDGTCIRDYIHVEDLVRAHFSGYEFLNTHNGYHDFNLGSEEGYSVKEVIEQFEKVIGEKLQVSPQPPRPGDPPELVANSAKARKQLGLSCQYNLESAIRHTYRWFEQREKKK